ncbi:MAG: PspC domain-containing protein [Patescibacteria group bacterium]|jgi:phage shock protein C
MAKNLMRSKKDKMVAGVCGGLGEYFDIDPNIVRIIFVAFTLLGGSGVLVYIIMWLVVPKEGEISYFEDLAGSKRGKSDPKENMKRAAREFKSEVKDVAKTKGRRDGTIIFAIILIFIGLIFLTNNFVSFAHIIKLWPLILIIVGLAVIFSRMDQ